VTQPKRLFCTRPFEWFETTQLDGRGGVYLCCPSWLGQPIGNLTHRSVEEIWNGPAAREIRRSILDGSFEYCDRSRCPYLQTETGPVVPRDAIDDPELAEVAARGLTRLPFGPRKVNCTFDQSCNLSCPSCRTHVIVERDAEEAILALQGRIRREALRDARFLSITGSGDPFGSPYFRSWLETMKRSEMPKLTHIHLHTNGQLWTPAAWGRIDPDVRALVQSTEISIDAACAETYALNRRGGHFERLLRNLAFIRQLRTLGPLRSVKISMVVQANNFREMPAFVELGMRFGFDIVYFGQLTNWGTFSDGEFRSRAVHFPRHPLHAEFLEVLRDPLFEDPRVDLGNLTDVRRSARA
jgi:MoaA/NifB/PqqE/SkfB family radical SAM enzyme